MTDDKKPKTNPFTGTLVIDEPTSAKAHPLASTEVLVDVPPPPPRAPPPAAARAPVPASPRLGAPPLRRDAKTTEIEAAPMTQPVPLRLAARPVPFSAPPDSQSRASQPPSGDRAPWAEIRSNVRPAEHALSGTLVDSPAPPAPPAPAPQVEVVTKGAPAAPSADELLPPSDPWGSQLEGVEPAAPVAAPPPAPPPAVKLPERPQVSRGLYKFTKGRT